MNDLLSTPKFVEKRLAGGWYLCSLWLIKVHQNSASPLENRLNFNMITMLYFFHWFNGLNIFILGVGIPDIVLWSGYVNYLLEVISNQESKLTHKTYIVQFLLFSVSIYSILLFIVKCVKFKIEIYISQMSLIYWLIKLRV